MEQKFTKPLKKIESLHQRMVLAALPGGAFAMDIDLFFRSDYGLTLIEFLCCETVRPADSHPRRYWYKNWRKFVELKKIRDVLKARLFLINYEQAGDGFGDVVIMRVPPECQPDEKTPIETVTIIQGDVGVFNEWIVGINSEVVNRAAIPIHCFYCKRLLPIDHVKCPGCDVNICFQCATIKWKACERCL